MQKNKKLEEFFVTLLNKGVEAAELISEQDKKAIAFAELAKAVAMATSGNCSIQEDINTEVKTGKDSIKKGAGKKKASKTVEEVAAPVVEEPAEEVVAEIVEPVEVGEETQEAVEVTEVTEVTEITEEESEDDAEWTDRMTEKYAQCLGDLNFYVESWGEDYVYGDCVRAFFETDEVGAEAVRPTNIEAFLIYLYSVYEESQS